MVGWDSLILPFSFNGGGSIVIEPCFRVDFGRIEVIAKFDFSLMPLLLLHLTLSLNFLPFLHQLVVHSVHFKLSLTYFSFFYSILLLAVPELAFQASHSLLAFAQLITKRKSFFRGLLFEFLMYCLRDDSDSSLYFDIDTCDLLLQVKD